jgi:uncharacterized HAD superfamily protein
MVTFCTILNKRHSTRFTADSFVRWNAWEIANITKDEFFRTLDEAWFSWKDVPEMEENIGEKLERIRPFGKVDVVTGRSQETVRPAKRWLREHNVSYDKFVRTPSTLAKADLTYDVFVDDSAELMSLLSSRANTHGILYTQPWNRNAPKMKGIFRVEKWAQIPKLLRHLRDFES